MTMFRDMFQLVNRTGAGLMARREQFGATIVGPSLSEQGRHIASNPDAAMANESAPTQIHTPEPTQHP